MNEEVRHFSLRKLSVGLASVLVGVSIFGASQTVKADTIADQNTSAVTSNAQSSDTQKNENAVKSSFSNDNQANNAQSNATQTQENEPKQAQAKNIQQDSVSKTQEATDSSNLQGKSAEKDIARRSSLQESNNQSNKVTEKTVQHDTLENGQKAQAFNLPKNSQKLAKKVLANNLIETASSTTTNGGFDEATWGKLDVNNWHGSVQDGVYQLTGYTGDKIHIIVPNEADFEKAGRSTNGLQVGITRDTISSIFSSHFSDHERSTIAFSETNNKKVKAVGTDWSNAFSGGKVRLSKFDGSNLDVSNVTNMSRMFYWNPIGDLTSLANWDTGKVTDMSEMFAHTSISNLSPLANWDTSKVTDMSAMFTLNSISDLTGLAKWDTSNVTYMGDMFSTNQISNLSPLANWNTSKVTNMREMFEHNLINNLTGLANWKTGNVTGMGDMFISNSIRDLTSLANWNVSNVTDMSNMFTLNSISDLKPLANWDTSKVTDMNSMFSGNKISDLTPLTHWNTSKVTNMSAMFDTNRISDLSPLAKWDTSKVIGMRCMFEQNSISDLTPLAKWNVSNVTDMSYMFASNPDLINLRPIANWNMSSVGDWGLNRLFDDDTKLDLTNINNTPLMQSFFKKPSMTQMLQGSTFIINNVDLVTQLVKVTTGKDAPILTNTAKRTITFNIPNAAPETIVQTINYRAVAPVQVNWPAPPKSSSSGGRAEMVLASLEMGTLVPYGPNNPNHVTPDSPNRVGPDLDNPYLPKIIKTYPVKESDWQLDTSKQNDDVIIDGVICFKPVKIPHVNGYKAYNKPAGDLQQRVVTELNSNDSGWTMPETSSTYTVEVPADDVIDLSDLVIAEPIHAQTRVKIAVPKRFKLRKHGKKHAVEHFTHRKNATRTFKKYRL